MLFSQAILLAEWEANAPLREALAIKRERLRVNRAQERRARPSSVQRETSYMPSIDKNDSEISFAGRCILEVAKGDRYVW